MVYHGDFCGMEISIWSKIVSWLQIALNVISVLLTTLAMKAGVNAKEKDGATKELIEQHRVSMVVWLVVSFMGILFGFLLLVATIQKRRPLLLLWIVWSILATIFGYGSLGHRIIFCCISVLLYGLGILTVYTFWREVGN